MSVGEFLMNMKVTVRLSRIESLLMTVLVMFVVYMLMLMGQSLMSVLMFMLFSQVQPQAYSHQKSCHHKVPSDWIFENKERN